MTDSTQNFENSALEKTLPPAETPEPASVPALVPIIKSVGLSEVFDVKDKDNKVIGHYQWAFHKNGKIDTLSVVKVMKGHDGEEQVLYKTYKESAIAKKAMEEALGKQEIKENLATVKASEEYKAKDGTIQKYGIENLLEFQLTGFVVVLSVLAILWAVIAAVSKFVNAAGLGKIEAPKSVSPAALQTAAPAMQPKTIHPGLSDEQFVAILSAAAAHILGKPVSVVKFKPLSTMDWTWAVQGRVALHSHKV